MTHWELNISSEKWDCLYENIWALQGVTKSHNKDISQVLKLLSEIRAKAWMNGAALEIMDGDAVHVPAEWPKAVMNRVQGSKKNKVFKVSAIGAQSCGKSTLLNTIFGLNFPVSSGRCTRGAYMQLVKVDESLWEELHCHYFAVFDSEGLMSRTRPGDSGFDNELATFVIGLSDLTLVVFKDEGNEMQHILPLAILVFLRKNLVGEPQACHFVYQKRGELGTLGKT